MCKDAGVHLVCGVCTHIRPGAKKIHCVVVIVHIEDLFGLAGREASNLRYPLLASLIFNCPPTIAHSPHPKLCRSFR